MNVLNLIFLGRCSSIKGLHKTIIDRCEKMPMEQWVTSPPMLGASPLAFLYPLVPIVLTFL